MKNLKRILTLLLAICMMLTVLAGCGDTSTDTNDNTVDNTTDSTGDTADTNDTGDTTEKPVSQDCHSASWLYHRPVLEPGCL